MVKIVDDKDKIVDEKGKAKGTKPNNQNWVGIGYISCAREIRARGGAWRTARHQTYGVPSVQKIIVLAEFSSL